MFWLAINGSRTPQGWEGLVLSILIKPKFRQIECPEIVDLNSLDTETC